MEASVQVCCGDCNLRPISDSDSHATLRLCSDVQLAYQGEERAISLEECVRESREAVNERVPVAMVGFLRSISVLVWRAAIELSVGAMEDSMRRITMTRSPSLAMASGALE